MSHLILIPRSFPVATVSLNITDFPAEVKRDQKNCMANGAMTAWYDIPDNRYCVFNYMLFSYSFNISLCGTFTGKGLTSISK